MLRKILRWFLVCAGVVALLLGLSAWWLSVYLSSNQDKILSEFVSTSGLDVTFRELDIRAWRTFPVVTFSADSLVIRDTTRSASEQPLLAAEHFRGSLTLGNLIFDTLRLNAFELSDGAIYVAGDSLGELNLGKLGRAKTPADTAASPGWVDPKMVWSGMKIALTNIDLAYLRPDRRKDIRLHLDSLRTETAKTPHGIHTDSELAASVSGIAFNTDKGYFLENARLTGNLHVDGNDGNWELHRTTLKIRNEKFTFAGELKTGPDKGLRLSVESPAAHYDSVAVLLPEEIRGKLARLHVKDRFPAKADVYTSLVHGENPEISIAFRLSGNDVRINQYDFRKAYTSGVFVNDLPVAEGGVAGSKKNFRVTLDSARAYQKELYLTMPWAIVRGVVGDTRLEAPVRVTGPTREINERVETENFIFGKGRFALNTRVNESLGYVPDIISSSDGRLRLFDTEVLYRPAGVTFPLRSMEVRKRGEDIRFRLRSGELSTGFDFEMAGTLDNLLPLLLERPADSIRTDVALHASRIRWRDFRAMFGEDGMFTGEEEKEEAALTQVRGADDRQVAAMKKALLGLQATFRPHIEASFDTVAYYDVLSVTGFNTGLRFDHDTLVLERTSFDWEGSAIDFGARLGLGRERATPFRLSVAAAELDLNRMRPALEYFGLQLPAGLDSLPRALSIDFAHRGVINDTFGIRPGDNAGRFAFREGREDLFSGELTYAPGPAGLRSDLHLRGDPALVNQLFAAEDFFFGTGRFRIDLGLDGTPADLDELIRSADLSLEIDSSRIEYRPADVFVPVRKFSVRSANEHVDYDLELFSDSTRRSVELHGTMDRLTAFLYPEPGKTFRMKAAASARSLRWSDIQDFIRGSDAGEPDTSSFDPQYLLSATGGIFSAFRPELSLSIDTFWTGKNTKLTQVRSGFHLEDSSRLVLEASGFRLGEGSVAFSADYDIDQKTRSPFNVKWRTDSLALGQVLEVLRTMDVALPDNEGSLAGTLSMDGDVVSKLNENKQRVMLDSTSGHLSLKLNGLELANWAALRDIGRKAKMKKRFEHLRFAPLNLEVTLKDGKVFIPRTEVQSTALQLFLEGKFDTINGPDLLVALPLRNIGRGVLESVPPNTGFAAAGWKVYLVMERDKKGEPRVRFRLGRGKYFRQRGRAEELRTLRREERAQRRIARKKRKSARNRE